MSATMTAPVMAHDLPTLNRANGATLWVFLLNGLMFSTWAGRIPSTQGMLDLTPGNLGLLLLVGSAGSLFGLPVAGRLAARFGAARTAQIGAGVSLGGLALAGVSIDIAHSVVLTAIVLFVTFFGVGQWDVAMNLQGTAVEHGLGRTILPRYHAAFSVGSVIGALVAAALAAVGLPLIVHFPVAASVLAIGALSASRAFLPRHAELAERADGAATSTAPAVPTEAESGAPAKHRSAWTEPRILLIGLLTLVAGFTEGAANDWISVAFVQGYHLPEWAGVLGFATFLGFMTIGRYVGTDLLDRYGRVPVLRVLFGLAGIGSLMVVFGTPVLAFLGAAIWGFGISLGFPVGLSAAADDQAKAPMRVSVVSTIAYSAFLVGPPALGFLGDHVGVLRALSVVSVMLILGYLALPAVAKPAVAAPAQAEDA